jgi:hypothetical protein
MPRGKWNHADSPETQSLAVLAVIRLENVPGAGSGGGVADRAAQIKASIIARGRILTISYLRQFTKVRTYFSLKSIIYLTR